MFAHGSGAGQGTRQGCVVNCQSFSLDYVNNLTGVNLKLISIKASAAKPVALRSSAVIITADNAVTSAVLSLGTASGGTQILNGVDLKGAAGVNYVPTNGILIIVADTDIYVVVTKVGATTAGQAVVNLEAWEINIKQPTNQGA